MKTNDFISGITGVVMLVMLYMHLTLSQKVSRISQNSYSSSAKDSTYRIKMFKTIDSLNKKDSVLAKSIVYLDSCNQAKATRVERAEKRGRFIGGLIKGLFPGM
jgi:hypothetical protein